MCFFFWRTSTNPKALVKPPDEIQLFIITVLHPLFSFLSSFPFFVITDNYIQFLFLKQHNFERENDTSFK